jgi:hypothetical protein
LNTLKEVSKRWELIAASLLRDGKPEERHIIPSVVCTATVSYNIGGIELPAESILSSASILGLKSSEHVSFPACPSCGSLSLLLEIACPSCESRDIRRIDIMVHYECGHTGSVDEFRASLERSGYVCPRCGKELKRVGIDYGRPGAGLRCGKCDSVFQFPVFNFICDKGHKTSLDSIGIARFPVFEVSMTTLVNASVVNKVLHIAKVLSEDYGIKVETFVPLVGESNVTHVVPLLVYLAGMKYAVEIIDDATDTVLLASSISKALDLRIKSIIVTDHDNAKKLAQMLNTSQFIIVPYGPGDELADLIARRLEIILQEAATS